MRSVVLKGSRLYYLVYNASWLLQVSIKFTKKKTSKETDMGIKWSLFIVQHTNHPVTVGCFNSPKKGLTLDTH